MKNEILTQQEIKKILAGFAQLSKLGEELSYKLNGGLSLQNVDISIPEVCKIDMSKVSTKAGVDYRGREIKFNPDLELTPPIYIRLKID